jgi:YidC/Oxa1 family membrane protein insertase
MSFEKRVFLALAVCAGIWLIFSLLNPPPPPEELDATGELAEADAPKEDAAKDETPAPEPVTSVEATPTSNVEIVQHELHNDMLALTVTNRSPARGGIIEGIHLLSPQFAEHETETNALDLAGAPTLEINFADPATEFAIPGGQAFTVHDASDSQITLLHADENVEIMQRVEQREGYEARLTVRVRNKTAKPQTHRMHVSTRVGLGGEESRYNIKRGMCRTSEDFEYEDQSDVEDGPITYSGGIVWGGIDNKYFGTLVVPREPFADCVIGNSEDGRFLVTNMGGNATTLEPGAVHEYELGLFFGAKEIESLQGFSAVDTGAELHLEEAVDWGILGALSETLGRLLLTMMRFFYGIVMQWGWAIVLLTIVVKLVTLPLTLKQMASMKAMKRIQPEMQKIKEKYADDRVKQGQEMQALFGRSGVNPLAGCLPLIVQMPIWFALYSMLGAAVELVHEPFLWLPDLTKQDPYYILPIALGAMMILQNRLMPQATTDEAQAKLMRWVMPIVFTAFMLFLPSGLGVYIFVNICLSVIQTAIQVGTKSDGPTKAGEAPKGGEKKKA